MGRALAGAVATGLAAQAVSAAVPSGGRLGAALAVGLGGAAGVGAYLLVAWTLRAPELTLRRPAPAVAEPAA